MSIERIELTWWMCAVYYLMSCGVLFHWVMFSCYWRDVVEWFTNSCGSLIQSRIKELERERDHWKAKAEGGSDE